MRVLLTGGRGLLAAAVAREFAPHTELHALERGQLDITHRASVEQAVETARPEVVINCASYNDVDGAEDDASRALAVNAIGVRELARAAGAAGAVFVHYSTDFVFDGTADRPYREEDAPNPRGVYASSKLLGEWLAGEHSRAYVLRVESLFGAPGPGGSRRGSLDTILERIRLGEPVPAFSDRTVSPTYTTDVAAATRALLAASAAPGLYHCVNSGAATWVEIAGEVARMLGRPADIAPITLASVGLRAPRPKYCALSNAKLAAAGVPMPDWRDALRRHVAAADRAATA